MMIRYKLWKMSKRAQPDAAFVARLATRFAPQQPTRSAHLATVKFATAACAIVLLLSGGTSAYAYSSDEVLPDHPLYGLRETVESVEEKVAITQDSKQAVQRKLLQRRLKEIRSMRQRKLQVAPTLVNKIQDRLEKLGENKEAETSRAAQAYRVLLEKRATAYDKREQERLDAESDEHFQQLETRIQRLELRARSLRPGALLQR
jgi:ribonuclease P protein component